MQKTQQMTKKYDKKHFIISNIIKTLEKRKANTYLLTFCQDIAVDIIYDI